MRTGTKICRALSSTLIAIPVSAIALLACNLLWEGLDVSGDDDICWLALLVGPICMIIFHRRFHTIRWLSPATAVAGVIGVYRSAVVFADMAEANLAHVPTGPLSGIGYPIMMFLSIFIGVASVFAIIGGLLGVVAYRIEKGAEPGTEGDGLKPAP